MTDNTQVQILFVFSELVTLAIRKSIKQSVHDFEKSKEYRGELFDFCDWDNLYSHIDIAINSQRIEFTHFIYILSDLSFIDEGISILCNEISNHPETELLYADSTSWLKPDFSPERLRMQFYFGNMIVFKALKSDFEKHRMHDTAFAEAFCRTIFLSRNPSKIVHLRFPIYESRLEANGFYLSSEEEADMKGCLSVILNGNQKTDEINIYTSTRYHLPRKIEIEPLISIVIPTQARWSLEGGTRQSYLLNAIRSIISKSTYQRYEFVLVVDTGFDQDLIDEIYALSQVEIQLVIWEKPFNFSEKMNLGVISSAGEYVLLLNDDVEVITPSWIEELLSTAQLPVAGMTGCMLYYEDDTIQHAGHAYFQGSPTHIGLGKQRGESGPNDEYLIVREVAGVTAACALMKREVFIEAGGFTSLLPGNFNDVDLCLKVRHLGYEIYWTPKAELYHYESKSRDAKVHNYELDFIARRWGSQLHDSKYFRYKP